MFYIDGLKSKTKLLEWSLLIEQGSFMFVTVEKDVHIFVQDVNPGPGSKTVFFVHGWPLNHQMYQYQLNVLPEHGFRCIWIYEGMGNLISHGLVTRMID